LCTRDKTYEEADEEAYVCGTKEWLVVFATLKLKKKKDTKISKVTFEYAEQDLWKS